MSGHSRRMLLFRRAAMRLSALGLICLWPYKIDLCLAQTPPPSDSQVTLKVKNDFIDSRGQPRPVTIRLWSEKPWNPNNPVREQVIRAGQLANIDLLSPDRYTVEIQWKDNVWRTLPMHLKQAVKDHPDMALLLSVLPRAPAGMKVAPPPAIDMSFGSLQNRGRFSGIAERLQDEELNQGFSEPSNWPRIIEFHNSYRDASGKGQAVEIRMRPERPLTAPGAKPSAGVKLDLGAGGAGDINLVSPDPFLVKITVGGKEYSASGLNVKRAIVGNDFSDDKAFFKIGSSSGSGEPTLTLLNTYDDDFRDPNGDKPTDLLHRPLRREKHNQQ
jgi:hypothetical protein